MSFSDVDVSTLVLLIILMMVMLAFFSATETAMMTLNRYRLRHLVKQRHRARAKRTGCCGDPIACSA